MTVDTILIDGTDLQTSARIIQVWGGVHAVADNRHGGFVIPQVNGVSYDTDPPFDTNTLSLGLMLRGGAPDVTGFNDAYRTLKLLCKPGRKVTLTRRLSFGAGNEDHTADARYYSGLSPDMQTPADGKLVLNFLILSGLWYGPTVATTPGTRTITGEAVTRRMTLALPGAGTLTNTTLGISVTVTATATLDVKAETSTGSVLDVVTSGDPLGAWFALAPGSNVITWSGAGTPTITYYPAYL